MVFYDQGFNNNYSIEGLISELDSIVDHISQANKNEVVLLGHSWGATLALEYMKTNSNKITHAIYASWVYDTQWIEFFMKKHSKFAEEVQSKIDKNIECPNEIYKNETLLYAPLYFTEESLETGKKVLSKINYNGLLFNEIQSSYLSDFDCKSIIKNHSTPATLIQGVNDNIVSAEYSTYGKKLNPEISTFLINKASHFPHIEQPNEFNQIIETVLNQEQKL